MTRSGDYDEDPYYIPPGEPDLAPSAISTGKGVTPRSFDALAQDLTRAQIEAACHPGAALVLAGAGTGKTSTLTAAVVHRIAIDGVVPARIIAVTFTNKAAHEMTSRVRIATGDEASSSWIGTYHGLGARQLRDAPEIAGLRPGFEILDADDNRRLVKRTMKELDLATDDDSSPGTTDPLKVVCNRLSKFKDNLMTPEGAALWIERKIAEANRTREAIDAHALRSAASVYGEYQTRLREANAADFGDLLLWSTLRMHEDETYRDDWASRFDWIHADEYQDVNFAQYSWLRALASDHRRIFVVGDDDQAIYSWRGSDITYIRRFTHDFPNARQVRLEENFRSTGHILGAANAVISRDTRRLGKTLFTKKEQGTQIEIVAFRDAQAESLGIATEITQRRTEGVAWNDMAILYRNNFLSRTYEEALMRALIPYVIVGDVGFYQRAEIKDALALLRLFLNPDDRQSDEAFRRVINEPRRGFGPKVMEVLEEEARFRKTSLLRALETAPLPPKARAAGLHFADAIRRVGNDQTASLSDQISLLLETTSYRAMLRESKAETSQDRLDNLSELVTLAGSFHTARELLDHTALATNRAEEEDAPRVQIMTLHKAKGLEFPHVFLPAWEEGTFPSDYGDPDEERRLAYVAITRAMRRATITYCGFRRGPARPSSFIEDIPEEHIIRGWLRDLDKPKISGGRRPIRRLRAR